ncbi:MAG: RecX family transcriptional regulator [Taibaiella sp.]|nr:RecX family transcriptional regulator [Taibaiella sp.]
MIQPAILHYCKYQERCHSEVRNKLYELGYNTSDVEQQLTELIEKGILSEERFAIAFSRGRWRMKQWGRVKIKQQLKLRKISDYCIKKGLAEIDGIEYEKVMDKLASKKVAELKSEKNIFIRKAKVYRYLIQKGYEQDIVREWLDAKL